MIGSKIPVRPHQDQNIGYIAEYLTAVGIVLKEVRVVGDEEKAIIDALNALRHRYTYVFTTGGIGPTHGDITVAQAFGVPVVRARSPCCTDGGRRKINSGPTCRPGRLEPHLAAIPRYVSIIGSFAINSVGVTEQTIRPLSMT